MASHFARMGSFFTVVSGGYGFQQLSSFNPPKKWHDQWVDLFLDGTAAYPREAKLRYAAWVVTCAPDGPGSLDNHIVEGGHVEGLVQSPYRAELSAMLAAMRWASHRHFKARLWCDCQGVCQGVRRLLRGGKVRINKPHSDLWQAIADLIAEGDPSDWVVCKVVSHGDYSKATSPLEEWAYWHNSLADRAVNQINERRDPAFWTAWRGLACALDKNRKLHTAILTTLLRTGRKAHQEQQRVPRVQTPQPGPEVTVHLPTGGWTLSDKLVKRYGCGNATALHQWWQRRGTSMLQSEHQLVWVSGVQLFASFNIDTAYVGPYVWKKRWYSVGDAIPAQADQPWGSRVKPFLLLLRSYLQQNGVTLCQKLTRPRSSTVSRWLVSYRLRWAPVVLDEVDRVLFHLRRRQLVTAADLAALTPPRTG